MDGICIVFNVVWTNTSDIDDLQEWICRPHTSVLKYLHDIVSTSRPNVMQKLHKLHLLSSIQRTYILYISQRAGFEHIYTRMHTHRSNIGAHRTH